MPQHRRPHPWRGLILHSFGGPSATRFYSGMSSRSRVHLDSGDGNLQLTRDWGPSWVNLAELEAVRMAAEGGQDAAERRAATRLCGPCRTVQFVGVR